MDLLLSTQLLLHPWQVAANKAAVWALLKGRTCSLPTKSHMAVVAARGKPSCLLHRHRALPGLDWTRTAWSGGLPQVLTPAPHAWDVAASHF